MARQTTLTEWTEHTAPQLVMDVRARWPWLLVECEAGEVRIRTVSCRGTLELKSICRENGEVWVVPRARVTAGSALMGFPSEVERGLQEYRAVVDALHFLTDLTNLTRIYADDNPTEGS